VAAAAVAAEMVAAVAETGAADGASVNLSQLTKRMTGGASRPFRV
jgi:hypothetical protein